MFPGEHSGDCVPLLLFVGLKRTSQFSTAMVIATSVCTWLRFPGERCGDLRFDMLFFVGTLCSLRCRQACRQVRLYCLLVVLASRGAPDVFRHLRGILLVMGATTTVQLSDIMIWVRIVILVVLVMCFFWAMTSRFIPRSALFGSTVDTWLASVYEYKTMEFSLSLCGNRDRYAQCKLCRFGWYVSARWCATTRAWSRRAENCGVPAVAVLVSGRRLVVLPLGLVQFLDIVVFMLVACKTGVTVQQTIATPQ